MNRFFILFLGIILFCLLFGTIEQNYFSAGDQRNFNSGSTSPKKTIEVQAQKIDLKKTGNDSGR